MKTVLQLERELNAAKKNKDRIYNKCSRHQDKHNDLIDQLSAAEYKLVETQIKLNQALRKSKLAQA